MTLSELIRLRGPLASMIASLRDDEGTLICEWARAPDQRDIALLDSLWEHFGALVRAAPRSAMHRR